MMAHTTHEAMNGDNTHHQDQSICPVSLSPINSTCSNSQNSIW